ncbi:hypothetical protein EXIGLDRAFT_694194 [Exidia glandulosa HHB12029]|uniref:Uncharacterized protein n=1 Tax=Exidia glandulosa HHB12029 TaxID=1314781 RepID=A0A165GRY7_EXIGL|nr:hypothetical protein EXIGLDRAFT_694194 [Exidia glandulosa HHB12029]
MRFSLLTSALAAVTLANAVVITQTLEPYGMCWVTGTETSTKTVPGVTTTLHEPETLTVTSTVYTYPTNFKERRDALPAQPQVTQFKERALPPQARARGGHNPPEETTYVEIVPCAETYTVSPVLTKSDEHITATATEYAATSTETYTYTFCVDNHLCQ